MNDWLSMIQSTILFFKPRWAIVRIRHKKRKRGRDQNFWLLQDCFFTPSSYSKIVNLKLFGAFRERPKKQTNALGNYWLTKSEAKKLKYFSSLDIFQITIKWQTSKKSFRIFNGVKMTAFSVPVLSLERPAWGDPQLHQGGLCPGGWRLDVRQEEPGCPQHLHQGK